MAHKGSHVNGPNSVSWITRVTWMAVISAIGVGIIYVPQPIQPILADEFGLSAQWAAASSVAVQTGYALGVFFLVALGDRYSARYQVTSQLAVTAIVLLGAAALPAYPLIVLAFFLAGASATVGQILVASALRLSPPESRAKTAATILGAIVIGLFTVRTVMGTLADLLGWRGAVAVIALIVAALIPVSWRYLPADTRDTPPRYGDILKSIPSVLKSSPALRHMAAIHTLVFSAFIAIWSLSALHAVDDIGVSVSTASLLSVAGIVGGVVTAVISGRTTRVTPTRLLTLSISGAALCAVISVVAPLNLDLLSLGLVALSFGMSSEQVVTQAAGLQSVSPDRSGRANTVYMGSTFVGSAGATAVAAWLYSTLGFEAVGLFALLLVSAASVVAIRAVRRGYVAAS